MRTGSGQPRSLGAEVTEVPQASVLDETLTADGRRWLRIFSLAIVVDFALILGVFGGRIGARDLDQFLVFHELQFWNANLFEGSKQWCPLMCSGIPLASEPQVPVLSLSMLLGYVAGPFWGIRLATVIYLALGWLGAFLYSGLCFPQRLQRALAASLFIGNGFFVCRIAIGHIDFLPFLLLPGALYLLHRGVEWTRPGGPSFRGIPLAIAVLALGAGFALAIDGSPVTVLHGLFWIFLYGAVLAFATRSFAPVLMLGAATALASFLDAGYLWPMVLGQEHAPRLQPDAFTHPLALPWYMLVPHWGRFFLPANGKGHELSVFIGPVIGTLIWRYRRPLGKALSRTQRIPLFVVVLVSLVLGMGSLQSLHVPRWLSPFDLLRPLPGFRSIGVTGRFWGFLSLPLSVLGAGALWAFLSSRPGRLKAALGVGLALLIQLGAQTTALLSSVVSGRPYQPVEWKGTWARGETVAFIERGAHLQGELITPIRAVLDCYDEDDIPHAEMNPGTGLVRSVALESGSGLEGATIRAHFVTWSRIRIDLEPSTGRPVTPNAGSQVEVVLNQAYHHFWTAAGCILARGRGNNLALCCDEARLCDGPVDLTFHDPGSALGWNVSKIAWPVWLGCLAALLFCRAAFWRRPDRAPALRRPGPTVAEAHRN